MQKSRDAADDARPPERIYSLMASKEENSARETRWRRQPTSRDLSHYRDATAPLSKDNNTWVLVWNAALGDAAKDARRRIPYWKNSKARRLR
ncbi:hypothetical protein KCP73_01730 [Salmonella enterica subsp. enterica]|nr:hypothetical protein KCP73_01730 [Salmonella enterica subsp. enterica]